MTRPLVPEPIASWARLKGEKGQGILCQNGVESDCNRVAADHLQRPLPYTPIRNSDFP